MNRLVSEGAARSRYYVWAHGGTGGSRWWWFAQW